jgi:hypothetical protein
MGIFSSKPKVDMESFCRDYYDSQMFHAIVDAEDGSRKILDAAFQLLTDSDPSFLKVAPALFECEMTAMHLELFALAFLKRFSNFEQAVQHSIFTLRYLQNKGRSDIWEAMGKYNTVIAQTATMDASGQQMSGDTAIGRMRITQVNLSRFETFKKWVKPRFSDPDNLTANEEEIVGCVTRVCNHIEADIIRNRQIGNRKIAALFVYRLGMENICGKDWQPSKDLGLRIVSQPLSMYEFATRMLKTVDLRPSVELWKDKEWCQIDGEACRVTDFTPLGSVVDKDGKVKAMDMTTPYASIIIECQKLGKNITGYITHKIDFGHLWAAFKERTVSEDEEVIIIWTRKNYKRFIVASPMMPKLWVMVCPKGAFESMTDNMYNPELTGEAWWNSIKPIVEWKPDVMK